MAGATEAETVGAAMAAAATEVETAEVAMAAEGMACTRETHTPFQVRS